MMEVVKKKILKLLYANVIYEQVDGVNSCGAKENLQYCGKEKG